MDLAMACGGRSQSRLAEQIVEGSVVGLPNILGKGGMGDHLLIGFDY